jgi:hypothetical protein
MFIDCSVSIVHRISSLLGRVALLSSVVHWNYFGIARSCESAIIWSVICYFRVQSYLN